MSCIFSDIDGTCTLYDPEIENPGWDDNGYCICEDDPNPRELCEEYKPDD